MRTDDDLRDALRDLAEEWDDDGTVKQLISRRHVARRRHRFAMVVASAAAVLLVVVSAIGLLGDDGRENSVITDGNRSPATTTTSTTRPDPSGLTLDSEQVAVASAVVDQFLHELRSGDLSAAAELWSGYPDLLPDDVTGRIAHLEELRADPEFATILAAGGFGSAVGQLGFTTPSWDWTTALPVVTVALPRNADGPLAAIAFLVDAPPSGPVDEDVGDEAREEAARRGARIQRISLPRSPDTDSVPASGSVIEAGQEIVVPRVPVEGGARAFVNGVEVPVEVDHEALTMTLRVPESATGHVVVTLTYATSELPNAEAFAYTVRPS